jgi:enediyne biosynthesis protein E4
MEIVRSFPAVIRLKKHLAQIMCDARLTRSSSALVCVLALLLTEGAAFSAVSIAPTEPVAADVPITFEEIAAESGIIFSIDSSPTSNKNQIETMVAGVALIDYDGDGFQDIFFANGAAIPSLKKEASRYKNRLFHNNRNGTFSDVTDIAGVDGDGYDIGASVGDYDNDGRPDLYVVSVTKNHLYHNNGDGTFSDITDKAGVSGGIYEGKKMWSVSAAWLDYNNDGLLDLFVSNYVKWEVNKDPECLVANIRNYCSPLLYQPLPNTLYRNNGDGTFTDVSTGTGIAQHLGRGMGVAIADYDGDGFMDIFVANDDSPNFLFHNLKGKNFEEVAVSSWVAYNPVGKTISGMGVDFRDVDNDGHPDIWFTALPTEMFPLFLNRGHGEFEDATASSGLAWATQGMAGWSNSIVDLDNDGWKDLFVARSNVLDPILASARSYKEPNAVFRNLRNQKFQDVSATAGAAFQLPALHRGSAVGDLDNDGRMDVVVSVLNGRAKVFHNTTKTSNHWILLRLRGVVSNRMGIGAQIKLTTPDGAQQYNQVTTSVGYASSSDSRVHFGLGASNIAKTIEISWPSGIRQTLKDVRADRVLDIEESNASSAQSK